MARIMKASNVGGPQSDRMAALRLRELATEVNTAVLDARKQAARVLAEARDEANAIVLQAEEAGYARGFDRGRSEGLARGERLAFKQIRGRLAGKATPLAALADRLATEIDRAGRALSGQAADRQGAPTDAPAEGLADAPTEGLLDRAACDVRILQRMLVEAFEAAGLPGGIDPSDDSTLPADTWTDLAAARRDIPADLPRPAEPDGDLVGVYRPVDTDQQVDPQPSPRGDGRQPALATEHPEVVTPA